jgi:hypothetical protein
MSKRILKFEELYESFDDSVYKETENVVGEYTHENVMLRDLYVEEKNMDDAWNIKGGSKTERPLEVFQMLDNSKFLLDGHHRICDYIIESDIIDKEEILDLEIYSNILQTPTKSAVEALDANLYQGYIPFTEWLEKISL